MCACNRAIRSGGADRRYRFTRNGIWRRMTESSPEAPASQASEISGKIALLRRSAGRFPGPMRAADALAATVGQWRDRAFRDRRDALRAISARTGWSLELLE